MKMKTAEKDYHANKLSDENTTTKSIWKAAYECLGNHRTSFPSQILHCGRLLSNPSIIANEVNLFFVDKIKKLKEEFAPDQSDEPITELKNFLSDKDVPADGVRFKELSDEDMDKLLKTLKGKKSLGLDWICGYSLKIASKCLKNELKAIINLCFKKNKFVQKWKCSKILPGWKNKGNRFELNPIQVGL